MTSYPKIFLVFLLAFLFSTPLWAAEDEPIEVTFEELVHHPQVFDGKRVKFEAFLELNSVWSYLHRSTGQFVASAVRNLPRKKIFHHWAFTLETKIPANALSVNRTQVEVVATFINRFNSDGSGNQICLDYCGDGTIRKIESIKVVERPKISKEVLGKIYSWSGPDGRIVKPLSTKSDDHEVLMEFWVEWVEWLKTKENRKIKPWIGKEYCEFDDVKTDYPCQWYLDAYVAANSPFQTFSHEQLSKPFFFTSIPNPEVYDEEEILDEVNGWAGCFCLEENCEQSFPPDEIFLYSPSLQDEFLCLDFYDYDDRVNWSPNISIYISSIPIESSE